MEQLSIYLIQMELQQYLNLSMLQVNINGTAFQWWCVFKNYIYLQTSTKKLVLVKKSNLTPEDYESLISLLSTHVQQKEICH